jgi:phosphoribosylformylglycinamidine cyclo-ligase
MTNRTPSAYAQVGVVAADEMPAFRPALDILRETFGFARLGRPVLDFGHYATVLDIGGRGIALSTDGVGTKLLVAQELDRFDTVGIDCVAMNANDVVCVGAEPVAMLDYVALERSDGNQLSELAMGLRRGAELAGISIPAGETAQVPELLHPTERGNGFDLVGTCIGVVELDRVIDGGRVEPGDVLIGYGSSGIHSNGLTLARRTFADHGWKLGRDVPELGTTLGEELLKPTVMYVKLGLDLLANANVRFLAHITGDGLLNLRRLEARVGFDIEALPEPQPIFDLVRTLGEIGNEEMYRVFNMGIGFCAVVPESDAAAAIATGMRHGMEAWRLGTAVASEDRAIRLRPLGMVGRGSTFERI